MSAPRYWAFFSYSSADRACAERLQREIEGYRIPAKLVGAPTSAGPAPTRFRATFRDRSELAAGHDLGARLEEAIAGSAWLIVLCSPASAKSEWVDQEIRRFATAHGRERILPVIVAGSPTDSYRDCFPPALHYGGTQVSAASGAQPVAADLRPGGDGWRLTRLKIIAGMLGVGLDELVRRDERRRHRILVAVTAGALAGMALTSGLAAMAVLERNEARNQRTQAQKLIAAMLGDLRQRLEQKGDLDLMDGAVARALAYYQNQNPRALDPAAKLQRAQALLTLGKIEFDGGRLDPAEQAFRQSLIASQQAPERGRLRAQAIFARSQAFYWLGYVAAQKDRLVEAEQDFRGYRDLAIRLNVLDPSNLDWRAEAADAEADLGMVLSAEDRRAEALAEYQKALPLLETRSSETTPIDRQIQAAQIHAAVADVLDVQGRLAEARAQRVAEATIYEEVRARDPTDRDATVDPVSNRLALAHLALLSGDARGAATRASEAAELAQALWVRKHSDADLESLCVISRARLAEARLALGDTRAAQAALDEASPHVAALRSRDATVGLWRRYADEAALGQAAIDRRHGKVEAARDLDQAVLADAASMLGPAVNSTARWLADEARLGLARDEARLGNAARARAEIDTIVADLAPNESRLEPILLVVLRQARRGQGLSGLAYLTHVSDVPIG